MRIHIPKTFVFLVLCGWVTVTQGHDHRGHGGISYFLSRGLEVTKPNLSFLQRVKRAVTGTDENKPEITLLSISTNVTSRFSKTLINSQMTNPSDTNKEATFRIMLPETAFMSRFTMIIDGEMYVAEVASKEDAEKQYEEAQKQNKTAGMVGSEKQTPEEEVRGMDKFKVSVNVAANSHIEFSLTYLELLERRHGRYEQRISVRPGQVVDDLNILVLIYEPQSIRRPTIMEPGSTSLTPQYTEILEVTSEVTEIQYAPSSEAQQAMSDGDHVGLNGDFVFSYDVEHEYDAGLIQVENNYFVHYFSPASDNQLEPLKKNVLFVIDISGSMAGDKIIQTRDAMLVILEQLRPEDKFMILLFDDQQELWPTSNPRLMSATSSNIEAAKGYVKERVTADGGTNINDALVAAGLYLNAIEQYGAAMIVFLTDGNPTVGVTSTEDILNNVEMATQGRVSIFSLGFGFNLNFDLLKAISYRNGGFARRIYQGIDALTQLEDFYDEISTPLMYDVKMIYPTNLINQVTQTSFAQYFEGSEIVVAGQFNNVPEAFEVRVECVILEPVALEKEVIPTATIDVPNAASQIYEQGFLEKLFVYMKIKDQLRRELMTDDPAEKENIRNLALQMALQYQLVTPLTSFIVVQDKPSDDILYEEYDSMLMASSFPRGPAVYADADIDYAYVYPVVLAGASGSGNFIQAATAFTLSLFAVSYMVME